MFAEDVVESVDAVDSSWNGVLVGMAAGAPFLVHSLQVEDCGNLCGLPLVAYGIPAVLVGGLIGGMIDEQINQTIYRRSHAPRITISPWLGRDQKGVMARVRF